TCPFCLPGSDLALHPFPTRRSSDLGEGPDLSSRQFAIMFIVYLDPPPHTVRGLAATLGVSKPAITRALDTLGGLDLLKRMRDEADRRNVLVQRTAKGSAFMQDFAEIIMRSARGLLA